MKNVILAIVFLLLLGVATLISLRLLRPASDTTADDAAHLFFHRVTNGKVYDAFRSTAAKLQSYNFAQFETSLDNFGLTAAGTEVQLDPPLIGTSEATVRGKFNAPDGEEHQVTLNLIYQGGRWRVYSILSDQSGDVLKLANTSTPGSGGTTDGSGVPSEAEIQELVLSTMMAFNEAVQLRYFALFYQQISQAWQQQTTPSKLGDAFSAFIDKGVSFPEIANMTATLSEPPTITDDGLLKIRGSYAHPRHEIRFYLRFTYESPKWRLFGLDIDLLRANDSQ